MDFPPDARPPTWSDVDRESLDRLLSSGLTPDQVGVLYGRSGSLVRLWARTWGLDCRALRARSIGLAVTHPHVAAEFLCVVDGAPLGHRPDDLLSASGARCSWRCSSCAEEWITSVANRTRRRSGCPACARRRGKELAQARQARSRPLSQVSEDMVGEFVVNLSRSDRDVTSTPSGSHDRILWRCRSGHHWETAARQRAKHGTQCPTCLAGLWTSRLEFEVAALVEASTGLTVTVGARLPRLDRASEDRVDLLVSEADMLVDLDPTGWHGADEALVRDARKLDRLAGARYVRVRPRALGILATERASPHQQVILSGNDEKDPWEWSVAVFEALRSFCPDVRVTVPPVEARIGALALADLRWRRLRTEPRVRSLLSEHPSIAADFVTAVDRPALTPADLAPSGDDRVLWRCRRCGHQWEARVANRTLLGTGCPPCAYRDGAARAATPHAGRSFADLHPGLIGYFLEDLTNPGKTLFDVKPNSIDRCWWSCPHCARPWITTPHALHRNPQSGCRACGVERSARKRRGPRPSKQQRRPPAT